MLFLLSLISLLLAPDSATIAFAGDAMQHQRQLDAARCKDGTYSYDGCFDAVAPWVSGADYAVVNLETPLGGAPYSGYPMFCAPDSYLDALVDAGFDLFLGANNHALDRRDRGVRRTVAQFEKRGLPFTGIWRNRAHRDSISPRIVDIRGFRVAFLNYTYGTNGITVQSDVVVDPIDRALISADIASARANGAEIIAACVHWGEEYQLHSNASQRSLAEWLVDRGVQLVIGSHPHVVQPVEMRIDSIDPTRNRFIVYSLGNFISAMRTTDTRGGGGVTVTLRRDSLGRAYVGGAESRLFFTHSPARRGEQFRLVPADSVLAGDPTAESQRRQFVARSGPVFRMREVGTTGK